MPTFLAVDHHRKQKGFRGTLHPHAGLVEIKELENIFLKDETHFALFSILTSLLAEFTDNSAANVQHHSLWSSIMMPTLRRDE
jgi:hypothetical protein